MFTLSFLNIRSGLLLFAKQEQDRFFIDFFPVLCYNTQDDSRENHCSLKNLKVCISLSLIKEDL